MTTTQPASLEARVEALERLAKDMPKAFAVATSLGNSMISLGESMRTTNAIAVDTARGLAELMAKVFEALIAMQVRLIALQRVLEEKNVLKDSDVAELEKAISEIDRMELESGSGPASEALRALRRFIAAQGPAPPAA